MTGNVFGKVVAKGFRRDYGKQANGSGPYSVFPETEVNLTPFPNWFTLES